MTNLIKSRSFTIIGALRLSPAPLPYFGRTLHLYPSGLLRPCSPHLWVKRWFPKKKFYTLNHWYKDDQLKGEKFEWFVCLGFCLHTCNSRDCIGDPHTLPFQSRIAHRPLLATWHHIKPDVPTATTVMTTVILPAFIRWLSLRFGAYNVWPWF